MSGMLHLGRRPRVWIAHLNLLYASTSRMACRTSSRPLGHRIFFKANCLCRGDCELSRPGVVTPEHTPLCSSSAKYTNEKPPSPSTLTILTVIVETRQSCDTSSVSNAHVRPLILTFADCWHTQDDSAQKASLIWYLMLSSVL